MHRLNVGLLTTILFLLAGRAPAADILYFASSTSSWVGHGATRTVTPNQGFTFGGFRYFNQGAYTNDLSFSITNFNSGSNSEWWYLDFVGAGNSLVTVGSYPDARRYPFQGISHPGLSFIGNGRGDNELTGQFQVLEATFDPGGHIQKFAADFIQYDEKRLDRWNRGSFRFNSDIPITIVPEPSLRALICTGLVAITSRALLSLGKNRSKS